MESSAQMAYPPLEDVGALALPGGDGTDVDMDASDAAVSDADSDYLELQADMAKLDASREAFLSQQLGEEYGSRPESRAPPVAASTPGSRGRGGTARGRKRGPRKAAEPTPEIKFRLAQAYNAFIGTHYDEAMDIVKEIIRVNAETFGAWSLLVSLFEESGQMTEALNAKVFAAHLRPKDVNSWIECATMALGMSADPTTLETEEQVEAERLDRLDKLQIAAMCYSAALRADPKHIAARIGKADVELELERFTQAADDYLRYLRRRPYDIEAVRHLAEASYDSTRQAEIAEKATEAYNTIITHLRNGGVLDNGFTLEWMDVIIFIELFASIGQYGKAAGAVGFLSRWLLGRPDELFWELYDDDREWDRYDNRRRLAKEYDSDRYPPETYGVGLPPDIRAKLAIYRMKLGQEEEAMDHLSWLEPDDPQTIEILSEAPQIAQDIAVQLTESQRYELALKYYEVYHYVRKKTMDDVDADALVQQGRCYLEMHDNTSAEDCFLAAIEADETNIDARYELARAYERAQEREEAFILVNEALSLEARAHGPRPDGRAYDNVRFVVDGRGKLIRKPKTYKKRAQSDKPAAARRPRVPRIRARRLAGDNKRAEFERQVSTRLKEKYELCQSLKTRAAEGDQEAMQEWMEAARELTDDFRSFRAFYPWEKYLKFLGYGNFFNEGDAHAGNSRLTAMAERLQQKLAPVDEDGDQQAQPILQRHEHRGIPFDDWLDLFLEYAISLAHARRPQEAYLVCQSARDSIVYQARENMFLIHLTWATCAIHAGDEETCVAVARYFMRDNQMNTDAYRLYSAICRACQAPSSWYSSGPAQKYMLRQIKQMDDTLMHPDEAGKYKVPGGGATAPRATGVDVALLMVYGHILFMSTSYNYALSYFRRAASVDPTNPLVNLSTGLSYIHWAFKRQAENRQYMLMQGLAFLFKYYELRLQSPVSEERQEAHFNVARTYHLMGVHHLAVEYYGRVLEEAERHPPPPPPPPPNHSDRRRDSLKQEEDGGDGVVATTKRVGVRDDLVLETAVNLRTYFLLTGDVEAARDVTDKYLVLE